MAGITVLLLAVTGCSAADSAAPRETPGPSGGREDVTGRTPPSPTSVLSSDEEQAVKAVLSAYERLIEIDDEAARTGDIPVAEYRAVAGDPVFSQWIATVEAYDENGLAQTGTTKVFDTDIDAVDLDQEPYPVVRFTACLDVTDVQIVVTRTGKKATAGDEPDRVEMPVKAVKYEGKWLVVKADVGKDPKPC